MYIYIYQTQVKTKANEAYLTSIRPASTRTNFGTHFLFSF